MQSKYDRHHLDFGLTANRNNQQLSKFKGILEKHVLDNGTKVIKGTYRKTQQVTHYYNPNTGLNVMKDTKGQFVSGWKLGDDQVINLLTRGNLQ